MLSVSSLHGTMQAISFGGISYSCVMISWAGMTLRVPVFAASIALYHRRIKVQFAIARTLCSGVV